MTVFFDKQRDHWRFDFWHNRKRHTGYCIDPETEQPAANKTDAKRIEAIEKGRVKGKGAPKAPRLLPGETTFAQAMAIYITPRMGTANWINIEAYVKELVEWFGAERAISEVSTTLVWRYINEYSRKQPYRVWIGGPKKKPGPGPLWKVIEGRFRSDSTTNRYLDALRTALNETHDVRDEITGRRLLDSVPDIPELDEPADEPNPVPLTVLASIIQDGPEHLSKAIMLTLAFGFRKMEALTLNRKKQIDWENCGVRLTSAGTKGKRGEFLPADDDVIGYLRQLDAEAEAAGVDTLVFIVNTKTGKARSIKSIKRSWQTALKARGLEGSYTWHNTKASFVSLMATLAAGRVVQSWARHVDYSTTERYLKVADEEKRAAGTRLIGKLKFAGIAFDAAPRPTRESHTAKTPEATSKRKSLKEMARPERFELPTLRFVGRGSPRKPLKK